MTRANNDPKALPPIVVGEYQIENKKSTDKKELEETIN